MQVAPIPRKGPKAHQLHGVHWTDDYAWLREKTNPELLEHIDRENAYTAAAMSGTDLLQGRLYDEILSRIQQTDLTVPVKDGPYLYYSRTEQGLQYPIYCRKADSPGALEEVFLDANLLAADHGYFHLGVIETSPDQHLLAYSTDIEGDEDYTIEIQDIETGTMYPDRIECTYDALAWGEDNRSFYYSVLDPARRPHRIFRHCLGQLASSDVLLYEEGDERFRLNLYKTRSKRFLLLELESSTTTEIWLAGKEGFQLFRARKQDIEYSIAHQGDSLYVRINDRGRNFRLVRVPLDNWHEDAWEEVLPHRGDVYLENVTALRDYLIVTERSGGLRRFRYQRRGETDWHSIEFGEAAYTVRLSGNLEYDAETLRYQFESPLTPPSVFDFHFATGLQELRKRMSLPAGFDAANYSVERRCATSHDGSAVPLVLIYRSGIARDRTHPTLLYGYGAYGANTDAGFSSARLSLIDRGVVYVIAQVRGGAEMGRPWHDSGRMNNKRNSFHDFFACAETLFAEGWTEKQKLIIEGGSAGGLLVGAAVTMRPELFGGVLAHVPFVDVLHTMLDASLPLTVGEYEEWGNPADREAFEYLRSYSPYDNVRPSAYPPMLVTAGLNDPRVSYWEPAKWVARLREHNTSQSEILFKVNMGAGHFGASGRYDRIHEVAFEYAWLLKTWNLL